MIVATKSRKGHYSHADGWSVAGFDERQWLYFQCSQCAYQHSLDKLHIPRR